MKNVIKIIAGRVITALLVVTLGVLAGLAAGPISEWIEGLRW